MIHCAVLADLDRCNEPDLAQRLNTDLPAQIAKVCKMRGISMAHISTDAIFNGRKQIYTEHDRPNPMNVYARTKLAGEQAVQTENQSVVIARVNFYGWSLGGRQSGGIFL